MLNLSLTEKGGSTNELSFDKDEVTVGRVRGNDIVLPKGNVSKHHCRLLIRGGEVLVEDLRSTNGTYVNGRKITSPLVIKGSDKVYIGDFILVVDDPSAAQDDADAAVPVASARRPTAPPPPPPARESASPAKSGCPAKTRNTCKY